MLRLLILNTLIVVVVVSSFGQIRTDSSKDDLHGPVRKAVTEHYLDFESGPKPAGKVETIYDRRGNTVVSIAQSTDGSLQKSEYGYTAAGKLRTMKFEPAGPEQAMFVYRYDRRGRLNREEALSAKGSVIYRTVYSYLSGGQIVVGKTFDSKGRLTMTSTTTLDTSGRKISEDQHKTRYFSGSDHGANSWTYLHDSKGRLSEWNLYRVDGAAKQLIAKRIYTYDAGGNVLTERESDADERPTGRTEYIYEFDRKGNWTKRTSKTIKIDEGIEIRDVDKITTRKIVYQ